MWINCSAQAIYTCPQTLPSKVAAQRAAVGGKRPGSAETPSYGSTTPTAGDAHRPAPTLTDHEGRDELQSDDAKSELPAAAKKTGVFYLLLKPHIRAVLATSFAISFLNVGTNVVFVLYSYTRVGLGGMGRSVIIFSIALENVFFDVPPLCSERQPMMRRDVGKSAQIGYALAGSGAVGVFFSLVFFPFIQQRFNNRRLYTNFCAFWPLAFVLMPIGNFAARLPMGGDPARQDAIAWAAIVAILIPVRFAMNVFP